MSEVLLDTNVVSFLVKNDSRAADYLKLLSGKTAAISFMTVAELYRWTIERNWGSAKIAELRILLQSYLQISYDDPIAWQWAKVMTIKGHPITGNDAWIAATAIRYQIPLVTHNPRHFSFIPDLQIVSIMPTP